MFIDVIASPRVWAMALALVAAGPTWAQGSVPAYQSAFEHYRGFADQSVGGWEAANREAAHIGGWRAYAKAARAPAEGAAIHPAGNTDPAGAHQGSHAPIPAGERP